jgi:Holliday junction resolvasome RuvABC endonuclease subunit
MATVLGWAVLDTDTGTCASGVIEYKDGNKPFPPEERWLNFKTDLAHLLSVEGIFPLYNVNAVVYERAHHRGGPATRSALGFETVLRMYCWEFDIPAFPIHTGSVKKDCSGMGKASKSDMMRSASLLTGRTITDDNEADAICMAHWGKGNLWIDEEGVVHKHIVEVPMKARRGKQKNRR